MKKLLTYILCFAMLTSAAATTAACSDKDPANTETSDTSVSSEADQTATDATEETDATDDTNATDSTKNTENQKWFTFNPKVTSQFMLDVYGQAKADAWNSLVDAVLAGEDTFECVDKHTYLWMMADFPDRYFPVLNDIVKTPDNYLDITVNGTAPIEYKVPKEEAAV